jgi:predicted MPP superfamily phosphohydrolase
MEQELLLLKTENMQLLKNIADLEQRLKKYTNGDNHKRYYEKNKEKYKELGANYLLKLKTDNPEKLKTYRRTAYENKKIKNEKERLLQEEISRMADNEKILPIG